MLARSEEEFEEFQKHDIEMKKLETKPRLMLEDELPEWMLKESEDEPDDDEPEEELGDRRARSKKEVDYTESLTEKEWLRAIGVSWCSYFALMLKIIIVEFNVSICI